MTATAHVSRWPALFLSGLVTGYQRYISPYKGFCCAYRAVHGGRSCSAHAKTLLARGGVRVAVAGIQRRFEACRLAFDGIGGGIEPKSKKDPDGAWPCKCYCGPSYDLGTIGLPIPIRWCW